jgi:hypothetical protein
VGDDILVNSEALLVTDFVNLKIKSAQSFGGAHRDSVCVHVFIGVSAHTRMSICVCTVFLIFFCYFLARKFYAVFLWTARLISYLLLIEVCCTLVFNIVCSIIKTGI